MLKFYVGKIMIKWLYLIFCYIGLHRYKKIDISFLKHAQRRPKASPLASDPERWAQ